MDLNKVVKIAKAEGDVEALCRSAKRGRVVYITIKCKW
jgi:hypothetical protein